MEKIVGSGKKKHNPLSRRKIITNEELGRFFGVGEWEIQRWNTAFKVERDNYNPKHIFSILDFVVWLISTGKVDAYVQSGRTVSDYTISREAE